jgi:hypothetical protein
MGWTYGYCGERECKQIFTSIYVNFLGNVHLEGK